MFEENLPSKTNMLIIKNSAWVKVEENQNIVFDDIIGDGTGTLEIGKNG